MPKGVYKRTKSPWNKGLTKETDERVRKNSEKLSEAHKGKKQSEETKKKRSEVLKGKKRSLEAKKNMSEAQQRRKERDGYMISPEARKKISDKLKGRKFSEETKKKMSESRLKRKQELGYLNSLEARKKLSIAKSGKNHHFYGKHFSEEHRKKISEAISGENHPNWNPNRAEVYAPYGEKFYNERLRNRKWELQNGRDMLTGTKLDPNKRPAYHHINYDKSNDVPDNHCFLSINNHMRITRYKSNPIKSERYKKILQENTLALKNGEIPK